MTPTVWTWGRAKNYRLGRDVLGHDSRLPEPVHGMDGAAAGAAATTTTRTADAADTAAADADAAVYADAAAAACGGGHTAVALRNGRLLAFGYSQYGQLGLGDRSDTHHPTPVLLPPSPLAAAYYAYPAAQQPRRSSDHHHHHASPSDASPETIPTRSDTTTTGGGAPPPSNALSTTTTVKETEPGGATRAVVEASLSLSSSSPPPPPPTPPSALSSDDSNSNDKNHQHHHRRTFEQPEDLATSPGATETQTAISTAKPIPTNNTNMPETTRTPPPANIRRTNAAAATARAAPPHKSDRLCPQLPALLPYDNEGRLTARVAEVCCGRYHTVARSVDGAVYTWGGGKNGRLGHGDEKIRLHPGCVEALLPHKAVAVTAGYHNNLVLTEQGDVWSWGWGAHGQLGLGDTLDRDRPTVIEDLSGLGVTALSCGDRHSFAVTSAGTVLGWGSNEFGQLGTARRGDTLLSPTPIPALAGLVVTALACGDRHSAAVTNVGAVYTWGCGTDGQCGHGDLRDVPRPRLVEALAHVHVVTIHCGHNFTLVMTDQGHVYAWGNNAYGQLGNDGVGKSPLPVRVMTPPGAVVSHVTCAHFHCVLITKSDAQLAAEKSSVSAANSLREIVAETHGDTLSAYDQEDVAAVSDRLDAILEDYAQRTTRCNTTADKQSRDLVIADILRLSSPSS